MWLIPTSRMVAPGLTNSVVMKPGRPMAATRMSPRRQTAGRSLVRRVADGDGGVGVGQQHGQGLADNVAASDDDRLLTLDGNVGAAENLHASGGGAGDEAGTLGAEVADVDRVEAIHILFRGDGEQNALGVHVVRQGKLDEDAIDVVTLH